MKIIQTLNVVDTLYIGDNTAVLIHDRGYGLRNNQIILDEKGNKHLILSIGMSNNTEYTNLLIKRHFNSKILRIVEEWLGKEN